MKPFDRPVRIGVLISGGGTTLLNFLERISKKELSAEVGVVIASRPDCKGVSRAIAAGLPCQVIERKAHSSIESFSQAVFQVIREAQIDLVTLAGFLSLLQIPDDYSGRVMNIHPSLIPAFCGHGFFGHHVHEAVVERGCKVTGCTVHFADNVYDHGPIIVQKTVPVVASDSADDVAARVFQAECDAYPEAIQLFAEGRLEIVGGRVRIASRAEGIG